MLDYKNCDHFCKYIYFCKDLIVSKEKGQCQCLCQPGTGLSGVQKCNTKEDCAEYCWNASMRSTYRGTKAGECLEEDCLSPAEGIGRCRCITTKRKMEDNKCFNNKLDVKFTTTTEEPSV